MTGEPVSPAGPEPLPPPPVPSSAPLTEARPEILIGAAAAGGFVVAKLLKAIRGR